ncbi:hypothetical protein [Novosphingobium resinovorum]|uniref:hypothetical protein n=1 Tax=Novosphingobium resinovorum TaxID=158500 RepID=UPI0018D3924C|nr:hypothetical protein [Novosphingobium resinovorum]
MLTSLLHFIGAYIGAVIIWSIVVVVLNLMMPEHKGPERRAGCFLYGVLAISGLAALSGNYAMAALGWLTGGVTIWYVYRAILRRRASRSTRTPFDE